MTRVFLAFDISDEVKTNLGSLVTTIEPQAKEAKWVKPKNFHVTLKFFGNVEESTLLKIKEIVEKGVRHSKPVSLQCVGIGAFPKWEYPRVIWASLEGSVASLSDLQQHFEEAFEKLGFEKEKREFKPHLTVARLKSPPQNAGWLKVLKEMKEKMFGVTTVDHLTLYKSELTKAGSIYTALEVFPFHKP